MEHQDIVDLLERGELEEAQRLIDLRNSKQGISGHDMQTLTHTLERAKVLKKPVRKKAAEKPVERPARAKSSGRGRAAAAAARKRGKR